MIRTANQLIAGFKYVAPFFLLVQICGCGYTTHSLLPGGARSIYVANFVNKIDMAQETSDARMYLGYRHALEAEITKAVVDRFIYDGNLRVSKEEGADIALVGELIDFRREGLRYDKNDNIEEYRIRLVVDIKLEDLRKKKILWKEKNFSGEATYRTTGSLAKSESSGIDDAVEDLSRRIVERTVEGW